MVARRGRCQTSKNNCASPHPVFDSPKDESEWPTFSERNAGVVLFDAFIARPILEEFANMIEVSAGMATVTADQYALRAALFKYRRTIRQLIVGDEEVCRYNASAQCRTDHTPGCAVHHLSSMRSLEKFGVVKNGTFNEMGLHDA